MSYLDSPRFHFSGYFQADVSTVNNDVRHFDTEKFQPDYQLRQTPSAMNGWWNPEGGGAFRLVQCQVTGAVLDGKPLKKDPILGMSVAGADGRVSGKLVDLDPQQQSCSEIWGLQVRLTGDNEKALFQGNFKVAPFIDLWRRQLAGGAGDQTLASYWQSVIQDVEWHGSNDSPLLKALRDASDDGMLSINFNVFGYSMNAAAADFTLGRLVGTIGPAKVSEPKHFIFGRHLMPALAGGNPTAPELGIYHFACSQDRTRNVLTADFGNCLPIANGEGEMADKGDLFMAVVKQETTLTDRNIDEAGLAILGPVNYRDNGWYDNTAGVQDFDYAGDKWVRENIDTHPLALVKKAADQGYEIMVPESGGGLFVRADQFVRRLNPGETGTIDFYASRYGLPIAGDIDLAFNNTMIGGGGSGRPLNPPVPIPDVGTPDNAIDFPDSITTGNDGHASMTVKAASAGPGNPRQYIDGQLYGIGYQLSNQPASYNANPWNFVSILVWDSFSINGQATWEDIEPILKQYGNLYPIMSKHLVDLGDRDSVLANLDILKLAFSLPPEDPNYMPVTRDLSADKRRAILAWLASQAGPKKAGAFARRSGAGSKKSAFAGSTGTGGKKAAFAEDSGMQTAPEDVGGKTRFINQILSKNK